MVNKQATTIRDRTLHGRKPLVSSLARFAIRKDTCSHTCANAQGGFALKINVGFCISKSAPYINELSEMHKTKSIHLHEVFGKFGETYIVNNTVSVNHGYIARPVGLIAVARKALETSGVRNVNIKTEEFTRHE